MNGVWTREVIGDADCPVMHRWRLVKLFGYKLMLHHFFRDDLDDFHDHPWSFVTLILKGGYWDMVPDATGALKIGEVMRVGRLRFRRATHLHRVRVMPGGCWTLVLSFPARREWGFVRRGRWMHYDEHHKLFGSTMRCDEGDRL